VHDCHQGKPYTNSYTRVRRHLCGVLESNENNGGIGISIFPKVSKEERQKYIKIEDVAQRMHGKKQKVQSDASSRFGGNTFTSPHASGSSGHAGDGSKRTKANFLTIGGRDEVNAKVVWFSMLVMYHSMFFVPPYWHDMVQSINKAPKGYKGLGYEKARIVLLDREKTKIQRALIQFTNEWVNCGVSIVFDGWTNVRNQHLINVLVVLASGAIFLATHDSSSITSSAQQFRAPTENH
jgi:hypothetical protein